MSLRNAEASMALRRLYAYGPALPGRGICANFDFDPRWLQAAFYCLRLNDNFPVPSGNPKQSAWRAYARTQDMWDMTTPYGRNRYALLRALIRMAEGEDVTSVDWPHPETKLFND